MAGGIAPGDDVRHVCALLRCHLCRFWGRKRRGGECMGQEILPLPPLFNLPSPHTTPSHCPFTFTHLRCGGQVISNDIRAVAQRQHVLDPHPTHRHVHPLFALNFLPPPSIHPPVLWWAGNLQSRTSSRLGPARPWPQPLAGTGPQPAWPGWQAPSGTEPAGGTGSAGSAAVITLVGRNLSLQ